MSVSVTGVQSVHDRFGRGDDLDHLPYIAQWRCNVVSFIAYRHAALVASRIRDHACAIRTRVMNHLHCGSTAQLCGVGTKWGACSFGVLMYHAEHVLILDSLDWSISNPQSILYRIWKGHIRLCSRIPHASNINAACPDIHFATFES